MHIVAIGGGDKEPAITSTLEYLPNPNVLIVPTACSTPNAFTKKVNACWNFFAGLGVPGVVLHDFGETPTKTEVDEMFGRAGLIYTIGGNSPHLLKTMPEHGSDVALVAAVKRGAVHAGVSAGALLPFKKLHSCVAKKPAEEVWDYEQLSGLGLLSAIATAHANQRDMTPDGQRFDSRLDHLKANFPADMPLGIGIENGAALIVRDEASHVLSATNTAKVHIIEQGNELQTIAFQHDDFLPVGIHAQLIS